MNEKELEDRATYRVIVRGQQQYSLCPANREIPSGWRDTDRIGTKKECLAYIMSRFFPIGTPRSTKLASRRASRQLDLVQATGKEGRSIIANG